MEPVEIKILLIRAGVPQKAIALKLGITISSVNQVISGLRRTKRIQEAIAEAVGKPMEKLWPNQNQKKPMNHVGFRVKRAA